MTTQNPNSNTNTPLDIKYKAKLNSNNDYFKLLLSKDFLDSNVHVEDDDILKIEKSYEAAHRIREFEIGLYWQRLNYLWVITAVLFAGWGTLALKIIDASGTTNSLIYFSMAILSFIGCIFTILTSFITVAGKYWQRVWEFHVRNLEVFVSGKIYSMPVKEKNTIEKRPSISKNIEMFNLFLLVVWVFSLFVSTILFFKNIQWDFGWAIFTLIVLVAIAYWYLRKQTKSSSDIDIMIDTPPPTNP